MPHCAKRAGVEVGVSDVFLQNLSVAMKMMRTRNPRAAYAFARWVMAAF
jgi:hypothetical protein